MFDEMHYKGDEEGDTCERSEKHERVEGGVIAKCEYRVTTACRIWLCKELPQDKSHLRPEPPQEKASPYKESWNSE